MSGLRAEALSLGYGGRVVVEGLDVAIPPGRITALVGPNGCGKSTILKGLARILRPLAGAVLIDGTAIATQPGKAIAQQLAILPQGPETPEGLSVRQLVGYGRYPYQRGMGALRAADHAAIETALASTGLVALAGHRVDALSGGQRQRAFIAMALCQDTQLLLLDEPTTFLDIAHQLDVLKLLHRLNAEQGRTIVMVLHDINHAARFAHHVLMVSDGALVAQGPPEAVITEASLAEVFGVRAEIAVSPRTGQLHCAILDLAD